MRKKLLERLRSGRALTLLVVPDSGAGIRTIRLSARHLRLAILALLIPPLIGLGGLTALAFVPGGLRLLVDPLGLARQNALLRHRLAAIDGDLEALRGRLAESSLLEARIRVLAGLEPANSEVRRMGVGGPELPTSDPLGRVDPELAAAARQAGRTAEELTREAEFQRYSYIEILGSLDSRREMLARIPTVSPVPAGEVSSRFGQRIDPFTEEESFHRGIDLSAERGTAILATAAGRVVFAGRDGAYGLTVRVDHGNGLETTYAHVLDIIVKRGDRVERGDEIARVGTTGRSTAPHVHYEVRQNGKAINPSAYILPNGEVID